MLEKYSIHTDLALEEKERFESDHVEVQGVILEEEYDKEREIRITKVKIEDGKKRGSRDGETCRHIYYDGSHRIWPSQTRNITGKFQKNWQNISKSS